MAPGEDVVEALESCRAPEVRCIVRIDGDEARRDARYTFIKNEDRIAAC